MESHASYRVVEVHPDGERVVISHALTHAEANRIINRTAACSPFNRLMIEFKIGGKWPSECLSVGTS